MARTSKANKAAAVEEPQRSGWRGLLHALFVRQVRVKRVEGKLKVGLDQEAAAAAAGSAKSAVPSDNPMHDELETLFKAAPAGSRHTLKYLSAVQNGLKQKDSKGMFLFTVDPAHLRTALRQLDGLMPERPTPGLAALRARVVDAIATRERKAKRMDLLSPRSDLMQNDRMEVREGSATEFDRLLQR